MISASSVETVRQTLANVTDRFADFQAQATDVRIDFPLFQRLALPIASGSIKIPGINIQDTRILRVAIVENYGKWLSQTTLPKLFVVGEPGRILAAGRGREFARSSPNQREVTIKGVHYLQEDSPVELGISLAEFVKSVRAHLKSQEKAQERHPPCCWGMHNFCR